LREPQPEEVTIAAHPNLAVYVSSHGFGHAVRVATILDEVLRLRRVGLRIVSRAPERLWSPRIDAVTVERRCEAVDPTVVERSDFRIDIVATRRRIKEFAAGYEAAVQREAKWIAQGSALVVGDVPPVAFDAALRARRPSIALANFTWDWIYWQLGLREAAERAAVSYRKADLLIECSPAAPMPAFTRRFRTGLIARSPQHCREEARRSLGLPSDKVIVLLALRASPKFLVKLPPACEQRHFVVTQDRAEARADVTTLSESSRFSDALAAADFIVAKPGYSILGDAAACGARLLYTEGTNFPEHPLLARWLATRSWARLLRDESLADGSWGKELHAFRQQPMPEHAATRAARVAAARIVELLD